MNAIDIGLTWSKLDQVRTILLEFGAARPGPMIDKLSVANDGCLLHVRPDPALSPERPDFCLEDHNHKRHARHAQPSKTPARRAAQATTAKRDGRLAPITQDAPTRDIQQLPPLPRRVFPPLVSHPTMELTGPPSPPHPWYVGGCLAL